MTERDLEPGLLPRGGAYRTLLSYQRALMVYDVTFWFCERFIKAGDRTRDQMLQAARSGKQNIVEGSKASRTSKETELRLTNVARASFEEALEDYLDFLRVRGLTCWSKDSREARYVRRLAQASGATSEVFREICATRDAAVVANIGICLLHQTTYLLRRQIARLERDFIEEGGIRERMRKVRVARRDGGGE